jgi:hypothetical protein
MVLLIVLLMMLVPAHLVLGCHEAFGMLLKLMAEFRVRREILIKA